MKQVYFFSLANQATFLRVLLTPVFYYYFFPTDKISAIICISVFTIASITDWLDGFLARKMGTVSRLGKFLDPFADKVLTSAAFWAFYEIGLMQLWMVLIIVIRDISLTLYRIYEEFKGKSIPANLFAKWKTAVQLITIYIVLTGITFPRIFADDQIITPILTEILASDYLQILFLVVTFYTLISGLVYLYKDFVMNVKQSGSEDL